MSPDFWNPAQSPSRLLISMRRQLALLLILFLLPLSGATFYPDDPLWQAPKPRPAESVKKRKFNELYDFYQNSFRTPGERQSETETIPARAVNTLGEVMDSDWYQNRHWRRRMTLAELKRGPGNANAPSMDGAWSVVDAKTEGITPGFQFKDARRRRYLLKFDPPENPELASAADVIGAKFFHALGYHVPENYIV